MIELHNGLIAVLGDLHGAWDDWDADYFNRSDYDLLLFTGDLGSGTLDNGVKVARSIARLAKPALVMPGNNDVQFAPQIAAEFAHQRGLIQILRAGAVDRSAALGRSSGRVQICGYSLHPLQYRDRKLTLLAGRPHSMGGNELSFSEELARNHGVTSLEESAKRLSELFDSVEGDEIIVLSHNGPMGLGGDPTDMWGCDFREGGGDWGDPDLAAGLRHARAIEKKIRAVIAGHMHLKTRGGGERPWKAIHAGIPHLNAARVPRIFAGRDEMVRSHIRLELTESDWVASEVLVGRS